MASEQAMSKEEFERKAVAVLEDMWHTHRAVAAMLDVVLVVSGRIVHARLPDAIHLIATSVQAIEAGKLLVVLHARNDR